MTRTGEIARLFINTLLLKACSPTIRGEHSRSGTLNLCQESEKGSAMTIIASMLWRRLDSPGHDTCSLERVDTSWSLRGTAVYRHEDGPAWLSYVVQCDDVWQTRFGRVQGALGNRSIDFVIARRGQSWT